MACAYLALKLFLVASIAKLIQPAWQLDRFSSLIAGWLMVQAIQAGMILVLSAVALLNSPLFLVLTLIYTAWIYWQTRSSETEYKLTYSSILKYPSAIAILIVLSLLCLRSLFLYDFTGDAQTYGIPRLAIWLNRDSVFVHMPTLQLNLFVNEWNAELNALAYALVSGGYSGFAFGNLEVLLWLFVSILWVGRILGASTFWAVILSAALGSAPVMVGLATTIKGDLLAITAFVIMIGWLGVIYTKREPSSAAFAMLLISGVLAVGSKVSVVLPVMAVLFIGLYTFGIEKIRRTLKLPMQAKAIFLSALMIFSSRLWMNWIVYENPLKRIDVEKAHFSLHNMLGNLDLASLRMFGVLDEVRGLGAMSALSGSMGGTAWFLVVAVGLTLCLRGLSHLRLKMSAAKQTKRLITVHHVALIGSAIIFTTLASMTLSAPYLWTFRYFTPGISILLLLVSAFVLRDEPNGWWRQTISILALLTVLLNINITMRQGEVFPTESWSTLIDAVRQAETPLQRMNLFIKGPYQTAAVESLKLDSTESLNILIFKDMETSLTPFLGSEAQNTIQLVDSEKHLIIAAGKAGWDVVAVLQAREQRGRGLNSALEEQGYMILIDSWQYLIAFPPLRLTLTPVSRFDDPKWSIWRSPENAVLTIHDGIPQIESRQPVDIGFMTQEFFTKEATLIRARFEGKIASKGHHAAHVSLHGNYPLIELPSGSYSSTQSFQGIIPASSTTPQRLSFGLGGWGEGSGHLRLVQLEMFELQINKKSDSPSPALLPRGPLLWRTP